MDIRPAVLADAGALAPLLSELGYPTAADEVRARLSRILAAPTSGALVAEVATSPVAVIAYQLIEHLERAAPTCRITALVTSPDRRRHGAAAALLAALEEIAAEAACDRLEVTTGPQREDALAFYLAAGFEERPRRLVRPRPTPAPRFAA